MDRLTQAFLPSSRIDLAREADFDIGPVQVHPARREVEVEGACRLLQPRVMQVLVALANSPHQVVSHQELIHRCWAGLSVSDDAVGRCIAQLRRLAASIADQPFEVATVAGVGYRLQLSAAGVERPKPERSARPSVAVIPFSNLSDDPGQAYFTEGMVEEIVASL
ncbi:MAG TPA: winged helix-turn-helix domain-containing protein, partial [Caulobacteraceae bacterium]|nr:winged helix-turn-helix domain-containing protein [Caulobacteraceae bacterium]